MSKKEYTTELLKLEDAQIERMEETEEEIILQISLKRKMHNCPRCKAETDQVHDYRIRAVRDLSIRGKPLNCCTADADTFVRHAAKGFRRLAHSLANISVLPIR